MLPAIVQEIIDLVVYEGPAVVKGVREVLPVVVNFFRKQANEDAVIVALHASRAAYEAEIDRELRAKYEPAPAPVAPAPAPAAVADTLPAPADDTDA